MNWFNIYLIYIGVFIVKINTTVFPNVALMSPT